MKSKLKQNIMILILSIVIFLILLEIGARVIAYFSPKFLCQTFSDPNDIFLCNLELQLAKNLEKYNQTTALATQNICDKLDFQLGWVPKPNCRTKIYSTNSKGFRGTKEYSLEKSKKRIITLGNSFTWGENVYNNETFPSFLEKFYNGSAEVINMGVHGYGPDQFYIYFARDGISYNPDIVVIGLFLPDIHRTIFKVRDYFKPRFIIQDGELKIDPESSEIPDIKSAMSKSAEVKKKPRLYSISFLHGLYGKFIRRATSYEYESALTLKIIEEMQKQLEDHNIKLIVLLIPEQGMIEKDNQNYFGALPKITAELKSKGIEYIDLQPVFMRDMKLNNQNLYNGHLNPEGNMVIARELYSYLNKNNPK